MYVITHAALSRLLYSVLLGLAGQIKELRGCGVRERKERLRTSETAALVTACEPTERLERGRSQRGGGWWAGSGAHYITDEELVESGLALLKSRGSCDLVRAS